MTLFIQLVNNIYEQIQIGLSIDLSVASNDLKQFVKETTTDIINKSASFHFYDAQKLCYQTLLQDIDMMFTLKLSTAVSFAHLFAPNFKYQGKDLERRCRLILDTDLPRITDIFNLGNEFLDNVTRKAMLDDDQLNLTLKDVELWTIGQDGNKHVDIEHLQSNIERIQELCKKLNALSLAPSWTSILKDIMDERLRAKEWEEEYSLSLVNVQLKWLHAIVLPWISHIMSRSNDEDADWYDFLRLKLRAEHVLYESIYQYRIGNILDTILDIPETNDAILDLKITVDKRGYLDDLEKKLLQEIKNRLLQLSVSTTSILEYYAACVQCLRQIDPSCKILLTVTDTIQRYIREYRKDVAQGVVTIIRNPENYDIQLRANDDEPYVFAIDELSNGKTQKEKIPDREHMLEKLEKLKAKSSDMAALLISMCKSVKDFVIAYGDRLGEILLKTKDYDTEEEILRLEIIKMNFPPDMFIRCDIMLKDVAESKRIDKMIHENEAIDNSFRSLIVSRKYWPGNNDSGDGDESEDNDDTHNIMEYWPHQKRLMKDYMAEYGRKKASRRLKFLPSLGTVSIELEFQSGKQELEVQPEAAVIISLYEHEGTALTKDDIATRLGIKKKVVVECMNFWTQKGILELMADGRYQLLSNLK
ncbi:hypothetical protein RMATCC62417_08665 [Rhizopus microsporus]|nr:hypothetical protein RMATCC62417_08665 [Rhizopus microsporus]